MKLNGIYYFNERLTFPPFAELEGPEVVGSYSKILHKENVSFISNGTIYNSFEIVAAVPEILFNQETIPSYDGMWCKHDIWEDDPSGNFSGHGFFVWNDEAYRTIIFYNQTVSDTFYTWFMNNAKEVEGIYSIKKTTLKGIADSIRKKRGTSENILVSDLANEIGNIETGITPSGTLEVTENGTHDVTEYASVTVNVEDASKSDLISLIDRSITQIDIPEGVTSIGAFAFSYCTNLERVTIPIGITLINTSAFSNTKLSSVIIPEGVTTLGKDIFYNCRNLTKITLPSSVENITELMFGRCVKLKTFICYAKTPPTLQANSFVDVPADCLIYVPAESVDAYKTAPNWSVRAEYIKPICVLNGTYLFDEFLGSGMESNHEENVQFTSNNKSFSQMRIYGFPELYYDDDFVYALDKGWMLGEEYRTVIFDNQTVSEEFYTWFTANATEVTE